MVYAVDRTGCNEFSRALLDVLANSFNDTEVVLRDREKLQRAIADRVRELAK